MNIENVSTLDVFLLKKLVNDVPRFKKDGVHKNFPEKIREKILERDEYTCRLCMECDREIAVHHIHPQGEPTEDNGIVLCYLCHMIVHLYLRYLKGYPHVPKWDERYNQLSSEIIMHLIVVGNEVHRQADEMDEIKRKMGIIHEIDRFKVLYDIEKATAEEYLKKLKKIPNYIRKKYHAW